MVGAEQVDDEKVDIEKLKVHAEKLDGFSQLPMVGIWDLQYISVIRRHYMEHGNPAQETQLVSNVKQIGDLH